MKSCWRPKLSAQTLIVAVLLAFALSWLSGCAPLGFGSVSPTITPIPTGPVWGLPFKAGTHVTFGLNGLHGDNFSSMPGTGKIVTYQFKGYASVVDASIDLLPDGTSVPVIPLASGTVLATWPMCHVVVVDHGNGVWVEYLHIVVAVTPGQQVTRNTVLGTTTTQISEGEPCRERFEGAGPVDHVHFAFLQGSDATGAGDFQSMVGRVLCGFLVKRDDNGTLANVSNPSQRYVPGQSFTVPTTCPTSSPQACLNTASAPNSAVSYAEVARRQGMFTSCPTATPAQQTLFLTSSKGMIYALDSATGHEKWQFDASGGLAPEIVGVYGTTVVLLKAGPKVNNFAVIGDLYGLDTQTGHVKWTLPQVSVIASDANAIIVENFLDNSGDLSRVDPQSGSRLWSVSPFGPWIGLASGNFVFFIN